MATITQQGAPQFPAITTSLPPSSQEAMDAAVQELQTKKEEWVAYTIRERLALIDQLIADFARIADRWVAASLQAKGLTPDAPTAGEEWGAGPYPVLKNLTQLRQALRDIEKTGHPKIPGPVKTRPDGQVTAQVFPYTRYDGLFFTGVKAEIWMEPGVSAESLASTQAAVYHEKTPGKVALVLGAGNVSSIGPMDIFYKLFVENQVVVYKANPVNAYLGPLIEEGFKGLIDRGFLRVVYGGAAEGSYLCKHAGVDEIHITGSDKTFDAIVFGTGKDGAKHKKDKKPHLQKRITGELGNVSPVIVVPGPWSASGVSYQAEHLASMLTNNAGFNCNATRVIINHTAWGQRQQLLQEMRGILAKVPPRSAYYPGAEQRQQAFVAEHPDAEQIGTAAEGQLPWTLVTGVDSARHDDICFTTEAFCGLFSETTLEAANAAEFLDRAVEFANEHIWGTLNATILIHPVSLKDPAVAAALERAIANLRYGNVGINYWAGTSFVLGTTTWGAFPGHPLHDIQSGTGVVHNTLMFSRPQKTVLRGPFKAQPTPPWFALHLGAGRAVFSKLVQFEAAPSPARVPGIFMAALRGK
ncbi:MAG TPA: aldehyde dehydrogenase family protein [Ktedonobacterales bacterium]|jgi:acyl-CoA reductase-like NAD-dependent aldehyde dehydrogenase